MLKPISKSPCKWPLMKKFNVIIANIPIIDKKLNICIILLASVSLVFYDS